MQVLNKQISHEYPERRQDERYELVSAIRFGLFLSHLMSLESEETLPYRRSSDSLVFKKKAFSEDFGRNMISVNWNMQYACIWMHANLLRNNQNESFVPETNQNDGKNIEILEAAFEPYYKEGGAFQMVNWPSCCRQN